MTYSSYVPISRVVGDDLLDHVLHGVNDGAVLRVEVDESDGGVAKPAVLNVRLRRVIVSDSLTSHHAQSDANLVGIVGHLAEGVEGRGVVERLERRCKVGRGRVRGLVHAALET
jgi:hypothetical protein